MIYVLDACALISLLLNENGADKVADIYEKASSGNAKIIMNAVNVTEVYYNFYRAFGKDTADEMISHLEASVVNIETKIDKDVITEAGRLKVKYKISLADSFAIAQAKVVNGILLTSDHHELETVEANEPIKFLWIR
jgi:predicted nucleic acid-binding protein